MRLSATSIVESITAMLIILLSFAVGMMIYMNVVRSEKILSKTQAHLALTQLMEKTTKEKLFFSSDFQINGLRVIRVIKEYPEYQDAFIVHLEAINPKGESIYTFQEIVFENPKE